MWRSWGDELPLFEASLDLDPSLDKWIANAAWQTAKSARATKSVIYESDFYATEKAEVSQQSAEEMLKEAAKIEATWPHKNTGRERGDTETRRKTG